MLGYGVMIWRSGEEVLPEPWKRCVAQWETGVGGLRWLDERGEAGGILALGGDGYPFHYRIRAATLAEVLERGLPPNDSPAIFGDDYVLPAGYNRLIEVDEDKLRACPPDEWLVVHAWDLS